MNRLERMTTKTGESLPIISNDETFEIYKKIKTLDVKTFFKLILDNNNILKLLTTHHSNLSPFKKFNYPILFSLYTNEDSPFGVVAKKESMKTEHAIGQIKERTEPNLEQLVKKLETRYVPLIEQLEVEDAIIELEKERREEFIKTHIIQTVMREMSDEKQMIKIIKLWLSGILS